MDNTCTLSPRRVFSRMAIILSILLATTTILQILWFAALPSLLGNDSWIIASSWGIWLATFVPMYVIAVPICVLLFRRIPSGAVSDSKLSGKNFILFLLMCFPLMYGGNWIGTLLSNLISGGTAENPLMNYTSEVIPIQMVVLVILAPIVEEYIFRKQLIDHTAKYGEKTAILFSAITFALFHMNIFQFFYAFGLGLVFAYVYVRTGRLRYSILLHGIINLWGSVIGPWIMSLLDNNAISQMDTAGILAAISTDSSMRLGLVLLCLYNVAVLCLSIAGVVILIVKRRRIVFLPAAEELPKGVQVKTAYLNIGSILFILICLGFMIYALL